MSERTRVPQFQLQKIYADGSREEPELHALNGIDAACRMGRRGFLLTSAIGAGALAVLAAGCDQGEKNPPSPPRPEEKPPAPIPPKSEGKAPAQKEPPLPQVYGKRIKGADAHTWGVITLAFSKDSKLLASGAADKLIKIWSLPDCKLLRTIKGHKGPVRSVAFSPDGKMLVAGSGDGAINAWSQPSGKLLKTIDKGNGKFACLSLSQDGTLLASSAFDASVILRSMPGGALLNTLQHKGTVGSLAFSPDGAKLACGEQGPDGIALWAVPSGERLARWGSRAVSLAFSPDGALLASRGVAREELSLWSMPSGKLLLHQSKPRTGYVESMAFSPDGESLAIGTWSEDILLLRKPFDKPALQLRGLEATPKVLAFSGNGRFLAAGSDNGSIFLWEITEGGTGGRFHAALFDPNAANKDVSVRQGTLADKSIYVGPCGTPLPPGATCTCNCVSGRNSPPAPAKSSGGGTICTCNKICTCVPIK